MQLTDPGPTADVMVWEGRSELALANFIDRYLAENPCPGHSTHPDHYRNWASDLRAAGQQRLAAAGDRRHLQAAG